MRRWIGWMAIAAGVALAVFSAIAFAGDHGATEGDPTAVEDDLTPQRSGGATIATTSTTILDTEPKWQESIHPGTFPNTRPAAPVSLEIQALGVDAPIRPYGVDAETGLMEVPSNVNEVAWYKYGPAPGSPGSAVLAAHVDLQSQGPGVFFDLVDLQPGDVIEIGYEDGTAEVFSVAARTTYLKEDLPTEAIFSRDGPSVLTLITCGGGFSASTSHYDSNVVVYAYPAGNELEDAPPLTR